MCFKRESIDDQFEHDLCLQRAKDFVFWLWRSKDPNNEIAM